MPAPAEDRRRPSGSETRQRSELIPVRVSKAEKADLEARAERAGLSVAAYIRQQTLDTPAPRQRPRPPVEVKTLALLLGQIGKVGSNLNQIAHRMNADPRISPLDVTFVKNIGDQVADLRAAVMKALGRQP